MTRLEKIKADDELLQQLLHIHGSAEGEVAHWMLARGYAIPTGDGVDLDCLLVAIATQAAERAVTPARAPE